MTFFIDAIVASAKLDDVSLEAGIVLEFSVADLDLGDSDGFELLIFRNGKWSPAANTCQNVGGGGQPYWVRD